MDSTAPAKSQPLHNFDLPLLKWNTDGSSSSGSRNHRRRSTKSPSRRPISSSASPIRRSPSRDSVPAPPPPPLRAPFRDSAVAPLTRESPVRGDFVMKRSPVRGESSKPSPFRECYLKHSLTGGDPERLSSIRDGALKLFRGGHSSLEAEALGKSKGGPVVYRGNPSKEIAPDGVMIRSSSPEQAKEKIEKKPKATNVDVPGVKRSKIVIKIPNKNNNKKLEEEKSQEEPPKFDNNGGHGGTEEVHRDGELNNDIDEEMRIWNLRPRKPKRKAPSADFGAEKVSASGNHGKAKKAQSPLKNPHRSGEKEPNSVGGGEMEKKNKEKKEKKDKKKLSINVSLTKREIEEDIYALTGSKPSRRPKKRAKNVQKKLDSVFPGLWLVSITPDSYKG